MSDSKSEVSLAFFLSFPCLQQAKLTVIPRLVPGNIRLNAICSTLPRAGMRRNVSSQRHGCGAHFNLVTDHTSFYERYGWQFYCMVQGDGEEEPSRLYIHTMQSVLLFAVPRKMSVRCDALIAPRKNPNDLSSSPIKA